MVFSLCPPGFSLHGALWLCNSFNQFLGRARILYSKVTLLNICALSKIVDFRNTIRSDAEAMLLFCALALASSYRSTVPETGRPAPELSPASVEVALSTSLSFRVSHIFVPAKSLYSASAPDYFKVRVLSLYLSLILTMLTSKFSNSQVERTGLECQEAKSFVPETACLELQSGTVRLP